MLASVLLADQLGGVGTWLMVQRVYSFETKRIAQCWAKNRMTEVRADITKVRRRGLRVVLL